MNNNNSINSPFRYASGKFYARKLILKYLPPHNSYIEPFAGGASIFFAKEKVSYNLLNDLDCELINVYRIIKEHPNDLIRFLTKDSINYQIIPEKIIAEIKMVNHFPQRKKYITSSKINLNLKMICREQEDGIILIEPHIVEL